MMREAVAHSLEAVAVHFNLSEAARCPSDGQVDLSGAVRNGENGGGHAHARATPHI